MRRAAWQRGGREGRTLLSLSATISIGVKKKKIKTKGPSGVGPQLVVMTDNTTKAKGAARLYVLLSVLSLFFTLRVASHPVGCQDVRSHSSEQFGRQRWRGVRLSLVSRRMEGSRVSLYLHRCEK